MKKLLCGVLVLFAAHVNAQQMNKQVKDKIKKKMVLINKVDRAGLTSFADFKTNYDVFYDAYQPDSATLTALPSALANKKITIVLGSWCSDSQLQVANFLKVADLMKLDTSKVNFIAVDGNKKAQNGLIDDLKIERVPTFIITDESGKEIGRIIESPYDSIEKDLLKIAGN